ncbi:MAG: hypothetical protein K1X44_00935 [Alphaproteobacteria bacterium]|nr:hypothetical protein [Alphaproteobacteria bacterium]
MTKKILNYVTFFSILLTLGGCGQKVVKPTPLPTPSDPSEPPSWWRPFPIKSEHDREKSDNKPFHEKEISGVN